MYKMIDLGISLLIITFFALFSIHVDALALSPLDIVRRDYLALTRRVTARHILLPKSTDAAIALKQNIRNRVSTTDDDDEMKMYIEDAFASAANKFSKDEDTSVNGGLLGILAPQGYCRAPELDRACFEVPLGEVCGPIESDYGYHLLLVTERTNCPKLDGGYTRILRGGKNGKIAILTGPPTGSKTIKEEAFDIILGQVGYWILVSFAGGILAEIAAKGAGVIETLPWEGQTPFG